MCENAVKRGVATSPSSQRKGGNGAFSVGFINQRRGRVGALKSGTKVESRKISHPQAGFVLHKWFGSGFFWTSQSDTFVTVALLTLAFLTFCIGCRKKKKKKGAGSILHGKHTWASCAHTHTHTHTHGF